MGAFLGIVLFFAVVLSAWGADLPWKTFSGSAADASNSGMGLCGGDKPAVFARLEKDGKTFVYFAAVDEEPYRVLFALLGPDGPVELGTGTVDPAKHDEIPPLKWKKFEGEQPCDLLYPSKA